MRSKTTLAVIVISAIIGVLSCTEAVQTSDYHAQKIPAVDEKLKQITVRTVSELGDQNWDSANHEMEASKFRRLVNKHTTTYTVLAAVHNICEYEERMTISHDTLFLGYSLTSDYVSTSWFIAELSFEVENPALEEHVVFFDGRKLTLDNIKHKK